MADLFIHLRIRTAYSLLEGALRIEALGALCHTHNMPALAITDSGNMFGALEFAQTLSAEGIQPMMGCTLSLHQGEAARARLSVLAFLAKDEIGYRHLMQLTSIAHGRADQFITMEDITDHQEGLICLTGGSEGVINQILTENREAVATQMLDRLASVFSDRLYIELQRHDLAEEKNAEPWLLAAAQKYGLGIVATNDAYFLNREDFEAHDALLCIAQGKKIFDQNRRSLTPEHYFKSTQEMAALFADLPEAISNSVEIARRTAFCPTVAAPVLPSFTAKEDEQDCLRTQAKEGLAKRLNQLKQKQTLAADEADYHARLDKELAMIVEMGFAGYFLIVADFVQWALKENIPVGPGRGSGAGSLVAYALMITDLDPLRFGLIFERFLNPERVSMPDFDIDFCQERRDEVVRYVRERYGADHVAHIITFGTLQARAVLRDVGRVLGMPYSQVDRLCKFVPNNPSHPVKLAEAIETEPALQEARDQDPQTAKLIDISLKLEGLYRHASTHAAGVVIGDRPLDEIIPITRDPRTHVQLTQFSMKWVEKAGLVKFDFLGLKTLTALRLTTDLLAQNGVQLDLQNLPLDDKATYQLLARAETSGVFQLESSGMRDVLRKALPDRIEDLIALVALYRPGPMDNINNYINAKKGESKPDYLHPSLEPVLRETFGVIIYQEQVMQIARVLAGYSNAEADLLRRVMGKKIKAEMALHKKRFVEGAKKNQVELVSANHIFDLVSRFAGYGFNKSHAAAYALLAYQTGWLKAHHPVEFFAALMTLDVHNPEKIATLKQEANRMGIEIVPPDINRSDALFTVEDGAILHALAAVRHVGGEAAASFVAVRKESGAFRDIFDFTDRCRPPALNKRALESLASTGAFDPIHDNRRQIFEHAATLVGFRRANNNQEALFDNTEQAWGNLPKCEEWTIPERLSKEFEASGMYLSGHPLTPWQEKFETLEISSYAEFSQMTATTGRVAGVITTIHERRSRKGNPFVFLALSDLSGSYEIVIFSELLRTVRSFLEIGQLVIADVEADREDEALRLRAQSLKLLDEQLQAPVRKQMQVRLFLEQIEALTLIKRELEAHPGGTRVSVVVNTAGRNVEIALPGGFVFNQEMTSVIKAIPGVARIEAA